MLAFWLGDSGVEKFIKGSHSLFEAVGLGVSETRALSNHLREDFERPN